jgi:hypothetical protein
MAPVFLFYRYPGTFLLRFVLLPGLGVTAVQDSAVSASSTTVGLFATNAIARSRLREQLESIRRDFDFSESSSSDNSDEESKNARSKMGEKIETVKSSNNKSNSMAKCRLEPPKKEDRKREKDYSRQDNSQNKGDHRKRRNHRRLEDPGREEGSKKQVKLVNQTISRSQTEFERQEEQEKPFDQRNFEFPCSPIDLKSPEGSGKQNDLKNQVDQLHPSQTDSRIHIDPRSQKDSGRLEDSRNQEDPILEDHRFHDGLERLHPSRDDVLLWENIDFKGQEGPMRKEKSKNSENPKRPKTSKRLKNHKRLDDPMQLENHRKQEDPKRLEESIKSGNPERPKSSKRLKNPRRPEDPLQVGDPNEEEDPKRLEDPIKLEDTIGQVDSSRRKERNLKENIKSKAPRNDKAKKKKKESTSVENLEAEDSNTSLPQALTSRPKRSKKRVQPQQPEPCAELVCQYCDKVKENISRRRLSKSIRNIS